jgi:hypothetical protein
MGLTPHARLNHQPSTINHQPSTINPQPSTMTDKQHLHGRYYDSTAEAVRTQNDRLRWQNQLSKQLAHKALDEPLLEADDMHIDARKNTHITRTGLGLKELLLLAGLGVPLIGTAGLAGAAFAPLLLEHLSPQPRAESPSQQPPPPVCDNSDADTRIVPRLRFGPERDASF